MKGIARTLAVSASLAFAVVALLSRDSFALATADPIPASQTGAAAAPAPRQANAAEELAAKYAPIMLLEPADSTCDPNTPFGPAPIEQLFAAQGLTLENEEQTEILEAPQKADLVGKGEGWYLDMPGDPRQPGCTFGQIVAGGDGRHVAYAHIATEPGDDRLVLQYWFFYILNDWNNKHEGDWEFIQLIFDATTPEEALAEGPVSTTFSQHGGGERAEWDSDKVKKEGDRPVVYVSQGSNANYYASRVYLGKGEPGTGFGCDDTSGHSLRLETEALLVPDDPASVEEWAWFAYEGRWGELLPGENKGPTGPITKTPYKTPLTWNDNQRDSSLSFGGESVTGVSYFFCDVAAFGGSLLNAAQENPIAILTFVFAVLGIVAVTSTTTINGSRRPLTFDIHNARNWQRPWKFGELVRGAFSIYRVKAVAFGLIASVAVIGGVIFGSIQSWLFSLGFLGDFIAVADSRGFSAVLAVIYGYSASLPFILLCTSAMIAAMDSIRRTGTFSVGGAYGRVWRELAPLFFARLKAIVIVVLLILSIVGIYWGLQRLIRWYFLEQAILFDGASRRESPAVSAGVTVGRWWTTAGRVALIAVYSTFPGPVLTFVLIMLTDLPLALVNAIGSALYILLLPWSGIALGLLYFDRKARMEGVEPVAEESTAPAAAAPAT